MSKICIVPNKDWEVLRQYLNCPGVVLIPEENLEKMSEKAQTAIKAAAENGYMDYNDGGEADIHVDLITCEEHFGMDSFLKDS